VFSHVLNDVPQVLNVFLAGVLNRSLRGHAKPKKVAFELRNPDLV
jgi:hypothetical protein